MKKVHTVQEAEKHFKENKGVGVWCVVGKSEKYCYNYQDAALFFNQFTNKLF